LNETHGAKDSYGMTRRDANDSYGMTRRDAKDSYGMTRRNAKDSYGMTRKIRLYPPDPFSHRITKVSCAKYKKNVAGNTHDVSTGFINELF
jgi:hypothetical protein